jgi:hypothetical protein
MPRVLSEEDIRLLKILAPEFSCEICNGSGMPYRSILPPIAHHYATSTDDFKARINRLNSDEIQYLVDLIITGKESLHCLPLECYDFFEGKVMEILGKEVASQLRRLYAITCE